MSMKNMGPRPAIKGTACRAGQDAYWEGVPMVANPFPDDNKNKRTMWFVGWIVEAAWAEPRCFPNSWYGDGGFPSKSQIFNKLRNANSRNNTVHREG